MKDLVIYQCILKYIYQLYEMNRRLQNKIEAGHTLMLHAKLLDVNFLCY